MFVEKLGKPSAFGEVWYAEADAPTGPWGSAVKILTHENYTFYNPRLHPEFTPTNSPILIFEGTYSQMFADRPPPLLVEKIIELTAIGDPGQAVEAGQAKQHLIRLL